MRVAKAIGVVVVSCLEFGADDDYETFILAFHTGDYDAVFDEALGFDRADDLEEDIRLPVRPRQPDNWVEINRIGLTNVKELIQNCTRKVMHSQRFNLDLRPNCDWTPDLEHNGRLQ